MIKLIKIMIHIPSHDKLPNFNGNQRVMSQKNITFMNIYPGKFEVSHIKV